MSFSSEVGKGFRAYSEANKVILKYKLLGRLWLPGLLSVAFALGYAILAIWYGSTFSRDGKDYGWILSWMGSFAYWVAIVAYAAAAVILFWISFKFIIQVLLSPVLSKISTDVEYLLMGKEPPKLTWKEGLEDFGRAMRLALRNLLHELFYGFLAGLIPVAGSVIGFGVSSYYTGFGYMDYTLERHRYSFAQSVLFLRQNRGLSVGIGAVANLGMMVPVVGWFVVPTYATVAATLETMRLLKAHKASGKP
jgi:CysZ protein